MPGKTTKRRNGTKSPPDGWIAPANPFASRTSSVMLHRDSYPFWVSYHSMYTTCVYTLPIGNAGTNAECSDSDWKRSSGSPSVLTWSVGTGASGANDVLFHFGMYNFVAEMS